MSELRIIMPSGAFGSSAGEDAICAAMRVIGVAFGGDGDWCAKYGCEVDTPVFTMRRYYWGDCDCGYEARKDEFETADPGHSAGCYYTILQAEKKAAGLSYCSKTEFHPVESGRTYDEDQKLKEAIYSDLIQRFNLPRKGCAIHCTCGAHERRMEWVEVNGHRSTCPLELPNFHFKPTGFRLSWYKYIGRDMEAKGELPGDFLVQCIASHPDGITLEQAIQKTAEQERETAEAFSRMFASLGVNT